MCVVVRLLLYSTTESKRVWSGYGERERGSDECALLYVVLLNRCLAGVFIAYLRHCHNSELVLS